MEILKIYTIKFLDGKVQNFYVNYQEEVERLVEKIELMNDTIIDWEERTLLKCAQCKMFIPHNEIRIVGHANSISTIYYCEECYVNKINCFAKLNELKNEHREREE